MTEEDFQQELGLRSVERVKFRIPTHPERRKATVIVAFRDQEEARKACDGGVVWKAQVWDCEPYWATLDPT